MCECGCVGNWSRYRLPAPGGDFYLISLITPCTNCDGGSGVRIELITTGSFEHEFYQREHYTAGEFPMLPYGDNKGNEIGTGFRQHEFIEALKSHLIGLDSVEMGEDGVLDEAAAEVILEEMYDDAQYHPEIITTPKEPKA